MILLEMHELVDMNLKSTVKSIVIKRSCIASMTSCFSHYWSSTSRHYTEFTDCGYWLSLLANFLTLNIKPYYCYFSVFD